MNKKLTKIIVIAMLLIMIASVVATVAIYLIN